MNRLADETSPYLLDHADNPVDWYPWGEEAFEKAREEDRPIFLSVGYSACHWCHVMKRESFEDPETAELLNEYFVPIKVDREERPDVDEIYMQAVQAMTGRGGWPMSVFLTPGLQPFYGGTYFPPEPKQGIPSFRTILERVRDTYQENREDVEESAGKLSRSLERLGSAPGGEGPPDAELLGSAFHALDNQFDEKWGGFGNAPKFPRPMDLQLLLRLGQHQPFSRSREMVQTTLEQMMYGGIYDQIGGGFARYSTDQQWLVPHFEKMLYDNAQLVEVYATGYQVFDDPRFGRIVRQTLEYVDREMTSPEGVFYSTQNAESEGEEGKYYVWDYDELVDVVPEDGETVAEFFGVSPRGNFEGKNILHVSQPLEAFCEEHGRSPEEFQTILWKAVASLLDHREQRIKPERDEKILTDWNGLMITAYARAAFVLNQSEYRERAEKALESLLELSVVDDQLHHVHKEDQTHTSAFLDDYAFLVKALLEVFQLTGNARWLTEARHFFDRAHDRFWDENEGGFTFTDERHKDLLVRSKNPQDKAQPSGNSEMVLNGLKLSAFTGEQQYEQIARDSLTVFSRLLEKQTTGLTRMLCGLYDYYAGSVEAVILGGDEERNDLLEPLRQHYVPSLVRLPIQPDQQDTLADLPLLSGRLDGPTPAAYLCEQGTCHHPAHDPSELSAQIEAMFDRSETMFEG